MDLHQYLQALRLQLRQEVAGVNDGVYFTRLTVHFDRLHINTNDEEEEIYEVLTLATRPTAEILDLDTWLIDLHSWMDEKFDNFVKLGSGWRVQQIKNFSIYFSIFPVF